MKVDADMVGGELQHTLAELIDLALQAKQAHWNLTGPQFKAVHEQLDELTADLREAGDEVAERAVAIGYAPDGRAGTVAKSSQVPGFPEGPVADDETVALVADRLAAVTDRLRERIDKLQKPDPVSQDLLIKVTATLDKHHWMFAVQRP